MIQLAGIRLELGSGVDGMTVVSTAEAVSCSPRVSAVVASWVKVRLMRSVGGASVSVAAGAVDGLVDQ